MLIDAIDTLEGPRRALTARDERRTPILGERVMEPLRPF